MDLRCRTRAGSARRGARAGPWCPGGRRAPRRRAIRGERARRRWVDEDDRRGTLARLREEIAHGRRTAARRSFEEYTGRKVRSELLATGRRRKEIDHLGEGRLGLPEERLHAFAHEHLPSEPRRVNSPRTAPEPAHPGGSGVIGWRRGTNACRAAPPHAAARCGQPLVAELTRATRTRARRSMHIRMVAPAGRYAGTLFA
jgi:hypothetical protein